MLHCTLRSPRAIQDHRGLWRGLRRREETEARALTVQRIQPGRAVFAIAMIAIGFWGLAQSTFVAIWAPGIQPADLRPALAVACALVSIVTGLALLSPRTAPMGAYVLFAFLCLWLLWAKGVPLVQSPGVLASWEGLGETAVVTAAAWALTAGLNGDQSGDRDLRGLATIGPRVLYGLALLAFGASHVGYPAFTASLVPPWLPWHLGWVYLTAATYIAAGVALVAGRLAYWAGVLSALQMALFGALVWMPAVLAGSRNADTLNEAAISFTLAVSGWVVASSINRQRAQASRAAQPANRDVGFEPAS